MQLVEFVIFTYQKSLTYLNDQRLNTVWQQWVFTKLLGLRYRIVYKKGTDNTTADALSRRTHEVGACCAISVVNTQWCTEVVQGYVNDLQAERLLAKLATTSSGFGQFFLVDGVTRHNNRIWVGNNDRLQQQIIKAFHNSPLGGHSGIPATTK